ncbi:hydroxymethylglutaryl-CoA reductase [Candidatus Woesearchaeota archaeon]|nr:hydroxymethylglutaryl-CoA reductase [Candidatus Woesearchaeota archaeon]
MATSSYSLKDILKQLAKGKIRLHELEQHMTRKEAALSRAKSIQKKTSISLSNISSFTIDAESTFGNIENMIGTVQVPVGIAGPVKINGGTFKGKAYIPLATTEGALVASVNRGCKAINLSGSATVRIIRKGQTRAPLMEAANNSSRERLLEYVTKSQSELKKIGESESRFLKIKGITPHTHRNLVWLRISADTGDAMGMNMISIAAQNICRHIEKKIRGSKYISVSGNLCIDKKPSELTLRHGRGRYVVAEATLKKNAIMNVLKTTAAEMEKINLYKNIIGSTIAGSYGMNAQFANVISAFYLATGQDIAHTVEGSHGITQMQAKGENLLVTVTIPAIQVGTVGGGTKLPCQKECISLTRIKDSKVPGNSADQLAEVTATAVLAGEISLMAALQSHQLVDAHKRLNR